MTDGSRPAPRKIAKIIALTVDLPLVPVTAMERCSATKCASSSERWMIGMACARAATTSATCSSTAVETTSAAQSWPKPLPSCGMHRDAEPLELLAQAGALAAVERPVAAADDAAHHRLELGERAHAGAAEPRIVKAALALGSGIGRASGAATNTNRPRACGRTAGTHASFDSRTQPCDTGRPSRPS